MALSWSQRRKYTYLSALGIVLLGILVWVYVAFIAVPPNCFDSKKNGDEIGVDCGGSCSLICKNQTREPTVSWARSFLTVSAASTTPASGQQAANFYTAAAYIKNTNQGAGAHNVAYSFQLFDEKNQLITERTGVTDLPPLPMIPLVVPSISAGTRTVARTLFSFSELPVWHTVSPDSLPTIHVANQTLASDGSRLSLVLQNDTVEDVSNLTVVGVLFDSSGAALAASKSLIASLPHKSSQTVTFTWPLGVPNVVRAEITLLPSF